MFDDFDLVGDISGSHFVRNYFSETFLDVCKNHVRLKLFEKMEALSPYFSFEYHYSFETGASLLKIEEMEDKDNELPFQYRVTVTSHASVKRVITAALSVFNEDADKFAKTAAEKGMRFF